MAKTRRPKGLIGKVTNNTSAAPPNPDGVPAAEDVRGAPVAASSVDAEKMQQEPVANPAPVSSVPVAAEKSKEPENENKMCAKTVAQLKAAGKIGWGRVQRAKTRAGLPDNASLEEAMVEDSAVNPAFAELEAATAGKATSAWGKVLAKRAGLPDSDASTEGDTGEVDPRPGEEATAAGKATPGWGNVARRAGLADARDAPPGTVGEGAMGIVNPDEEAVTAGKGDGAESPGALACPTNAMSLRSLMTDHPAPRVQ